MTQHLNPLDPLFIDHLFSKIADQANDRLMDKARKEVREEAANAFRESTFRPSTHAKNRDLQPSRLSEQLRQEAMSRGIDTIDDLFSTNNPEAWEKYIPLFIDLYVDRATITELGVALTRDHIPVLMSDMVSDKAARTWMELWKVSTKQFVEFKIPIELLDAAVRYKESRGDVKYKKTNGDRRILLELDSMLRHFLEPLVGWEKPEN